MGLIHDIQENPIYIGYGIWFILLMVRWMMNGSIYSDEQQEFYRNGGERAPWHSSRNDHESFLSMFTFHWTPLEQDTVKMRRRKQQANRAHLIFGIYSLLLLFAWIYVHVRR